MLQEQTRICYKNIRDVFNERTRTCLKNIWVRELFYWNTRESIQRKYENVFKELTNTLFRLRQESRVRD